MSIDINDAPVGYVAAQADSSSCLNCDFSPPHCPGSISGIIRCVPSERADGQYVVFIRKEEHVD